MSLPAHTPDDLRIASIDYVNLAGIEANELGIKNVETPGGLEKKIGQGWMSITGVVVEFLPGGIRGVEMDHTNRWKYTEPPRVSAITTIWHEEKNPEVHPHKKRDHNKVVSDLMRLFVVPEVLATS